MDGSTIVLDSTRPAAIFHNDDREPRQELDALSRSLAACPAAASPAPPIPVPSP